MYKVSEYLSRHKPEVVEFAVLILFSSTGKSTPEAHLSQARFAAELVLSLPFVVV
jgi:hypothetical protein